MKVGKLPCLRFSPATHRASHTHRGTKASGAEACTRGKSRALAESGQLSQLLRCKQLPDFKPQIGGLLLEFGLKISNLFLFGSDGSRISLGI